MNKEKIEVFASGSVYIIDDYKTMQIFGKTTKTVNLTQDKGHVAELAAFTNAIKKGDSSPIPFREICHTTDATFKVLDSITMSGESQHLQP